MFSQKSLLKSARWIQFYIFLYRVILSKKYILCLLLRKSVYKCEIKSIDSIEMNCYRIFIWILCGYNKGMIFNFQICIVISNKRVNCNAIIFSIKTMCYILYNPIIIFWKHWYNFWFTIKQRLFCIIWKCHSVNAPVWITEHSNYRFILTTILQFPWFGKS